MVVFYRVAGASEYLAITGYRTSDIKLARKAWILPGQSCTLFDISPVNYMFEVQAMSAEKLPLILSAVFTIGPRANNDDDLLKYAKLIYSHDKLPSGIKELVQGVIEGEIRVLAASMTMEEILRGTKSLKDEVFEKVQLELNQFGLLIYNATVKQLVDSSQRIQVVVRGGGGVGGENTVRQSAVLDAKLITRILLFSSTIIIGILSELLMSAFPHFQNIREHFSAMLYVGGILFLSTALFVYVLMMCTLYQLNHNHITPNYIVFIALISISGVLLMAFNGVLLVLVNQHSALLAVPILSVILVSVGILVYVSITDQRHDDQDDEGNADLKDYESEIKTTFDLSIFVNITAFGVQICTVFCYLKNVPNQVHHLQLDLSVFFLTSTLGIFSMTVTSLPLMFRRKIMRDSFVAILKALRYVTLALLALSAFVIAMEFLDGIIVVAFFPEFIAAVTYFTMEFCRRTAAAVDGVHHAINFDPLLDPIYMGITTTNFMMLVVLCVEKNVGGEEYSLFLKSIVFFLFSAIIAGLSRMVLTLKPLETESWATAVKLLSFFSPGLLELGMIAAAAINIF